MKLFLFGFSSLLSLSFFTPAFISVINSLFAAFHAFSDTLFSGLLGYTIYNDSYQPCVTLVRWLLVECLSAILLRFENQAAVTADGLDEGEDVTIVLELD